MSKLVLFTYTAWKLDKTLTCMILQNSENVGLKKRKVPHFNELKRDLTFERLVERPNEIRAVMLNPTTQAVHYNAESQQLKMTLLSPW